MSLISLKGKVGIGEEKNTVGTNTMSLTVVFQEAVKKDDIHQAMALLLKYPETETWSDNPLHIACEHGSLRVAIEIGRRWPKLATTANQDGDIAMHLVSARGDGEMVEFLGKLNPGSCLVENKYTMIPLHVAVVKGHSVVIRKLVSLCPESLKKVTSKQDTVFHLALKNSQSGVFQVLVEETTKLNQGHLLNNKDDEGNTVLHIAAFKRLTAFHWPYKDGSELQERKGLNSFRHVCANSQDTASKEISLMLQKAAEDEICSLEPLQLPRVRNKALIRLPVETRNVLLVVLVMIAAAAFTVTCNLPDALLAQIYHSGLTLHATANDVISGRLPTVVYLMVFNSAGFMTSMAVISYLTWPLPLRSILLFVVVCTCIVYIILVNKITPKFSVIVGNFSFSSITLVWSSALAFIVFGVTMIDMGKYALRSLYVAMEIGRWWPKLATTADQDGYTAMHFVSAKGDVKMVEFLAKLDPGFCQNIFSVIPLNIAAVNCHSDVIGGQYFLLLTVKDVPWNLHSSPGFRTGINKMACGDEKHLTGSPGNDCCNLPDALLISSRLPTVVYIMVLTSAAMMASMVLISILNFSISSIALVWTSALTSLSSESQTHNLEVRGNML
ncbi:hypothetical protein JRO89_XS11G0130100 [Xanthoceras sorbifolium]|uniref:PGG domain-containing protein n=1 Tax=Xanthoceras sorbifolium TaxID=99658 RepID=A0ABQ8HFG6_9ROSI|nr:hypothetical protein JRO89_XS11G0130100 [Xanthoceras sorbifolium]